MTPETMLLKRGRIKTHFAEPERVFLWLDGSPECPAPQIYQWGEILPGFGVMPMHWLLSMASGGMRLMRIGRDVHAYEDRSGDSRGTS